MAMARAFYQGVPKVWEAKWATGRTSVLNECAGQFLSLLLIHTFRLSLTLFFVREKYLNRKINLHFLRVPAKTSLKLYNSSFENILRSTFS